MRKPKPTTNITMMSRAAAYSAQVMSWPYSPHQSSAKTVASALKRTTARMIMVGRWWTLDDGAASGPEQRTGDTSPRFYPSLTIDPQPLCNSVRVPFDNSVNSARAGRERGGGALRGSAPPRARAATLQVRRGAVLAQE